MTCKTGKMSVGPCGVNMFKTLRLRDRWAEVDAYSMNPVGKYSRKRSFEFQILARAGELTPPPAGCLLLSTLNLAHR